MKSEVKLEPIENLMIKRLSHLIGEPYRPKENQFVGAVEVTRKVDFIKTRRAKFIVMDRLEVELG